MVGALLDVNDLIDMVDTVVRSGATVSIPSVTVAPRPPARPGRGVRMTTTKVEFDPFSDEYFDDPTEIYRRLRDEAPVYFSEKYGFYALSRFADVVSAHRDLEAFTSTHGIELLTLTTKTPEEVATYRQIIMMDPPEHDVHAGAGQPGVHPSRHGRRSSR